MQELLQEDKIQLASATSPSLQIKQKMAVHKDSLMLRKLSGSLDADVRRVQSDLQG